MGGWFRVKFVREGFKFGQLVRASTLLLQDTACAQRNPATYNCENIQGNLNCTSGRKHQQLSNGYETGFHAYPSCEA